MIENFFMPEILDTNRIKPIARNNHNYDEDYWFEINKNRLFLRNYLLWVDKTNSLQDCHNTTNCRVAKKNNYVFEGIHRQELLKYREFRDIKVYSKLKNS